MLPGSSQEAISNTLTLFRFDESIVFKLPGSGESLDSCGKPGYIGHTDGQSVHFLYRSKTCHRKECPVCWHDWQKRESMAIQDRITAYFTGGYTKRRMPVHYVISPPQSCEYGTKGQYRALKKKAYEIGKQRGIDGGCLIFHERAKRYSDSEEYEFIHCSQGPHFHVIGDGWLSQIKDFYLDDGWIVKNLRIRKFGTVFKTAFYILDHAAIGYPANSQGKNLSMASVTWFGSMSYNKLKVPRFTGPDNIYCPICKTEIDKNDWFVLDWIGLKDPPDHEFGVSEIGQNGFYLGRPLTGWSGFY